MYIYEEIVLFIDNELFYFYLENNNYIFFFFDLYCMLYERDKLKVNILMLLL